VRQFSFILLFLAALGVNQASATDSVYQLEYPSPDGKSVSMESFKGKVVLLNFWATWCPPCIKEMPSMQRLRDKVGTEDFEIVAINVGESADAVDAFLMARDPELTFPILLDENGSAFKKLGVMGLPSTYLFSAEGELLETIVGGREWDDSNHVDMVREAIKR